MGVASSLFIYGSVPISALLPLVHQTRNQPWAANITAESQTQISSFNAYSECLQCMLCLNSDVFFIVLALLQYAGIQMKQWGWSSDAQQGCI